MRQDRRDRDPWEGYEFIDINSAQMRRRPAPSRPSGLPGAPPPGGAGISPPEGPKESSGKGVPQGRDPRRRPPSQPRRPQGGSP